MTTIAQALADAARALAPVTDTARLDAELLMAHAIGAARGELILRHLHDAVPAGFAALVERRRAHEPLAYITGHQEFWGLDLAVGPGVLIPRGDSEVLIAQAIDRLRDRPPARVLDLGTGSGALLLAALHHWPAATGVGIDRCAGALDFARGNAARLGLAGRVRMQTADWTQADWAQADWAGALGQFDLVLANPPYVEAGAALDRAVVDYEPHTALFAGVDGLDDYRVIVPHLPRLMAPGGVAMVEIGCTQSAALCAMARTAGLAARVHADLAGRPRAIAMCAADDEFRTT